MKASDSAAETAVFELKGSVLTVMVLYIRETDPELLYPQLKKKIGPARSFFNNAPLLIDLKSLTDEEQVALDILRSQNNRDPVFINIADRNILGENKSLPFQITPLTPSTLALLQMAKLPLPGALFARPEPSLVAP